MLYVVNPATEEILHTIEPAGAPDVNRAVARARAALPGWRALPPSRRARLLGDLADAVTDAADELAALESANVGKPLADAREEISMAIDLLRYYASAVDKHFAHTIPVDNGLRCG